MIATPKHRLRWYQYSLRSLFVLMVLVAIAGSWFAVKRQQVERERAAVRWFEELGGRVTYDYQVDAPRNAEPPGPAWLRAWLGDDFFAHVAWLHLSGPAVTDVDVAQLEGTAELQALDLGHTQTTDAGLRHVKDLTRLQTLSLGGTKVTDVGLEHLKRLTQLEYLFLGETAVTDVGTEQLKGLTQLKTLNLIRTRVTDEGVKKLQEALPNCKITR